MGINVRGRHQNQQVLDAADIRAGWLSGCECIEEAVREKKYSWIGLHISPVPSDSYQAVLSKGKKNPPSSCQGSGSIDNIGLKL